VAVLCFRTQSSSNLRFEAFLPLFTGIILSIDTMIGFTVAVLASIAATTSAAWTKDSFKHGVYFGDSYTDTGRGMIGAKPAGWKEPAVSQLHITTKEYGIVHRLQQGCSNESWLQQVESFTSG
jgi:phospholipase/lecithinase/hemolysin